MLLYPLFSTSQVQSELQNGMKDGFDLMAKLCETVTLNFELRWSTQDWSMPGMRVSCGPLLLYPTLLGGSVLIDKRKQAMYFCINVCHDAVICKIFTATVNQNYGLR